MDQWYHPLLAEPIYEFYPAGGRYYLLPLAFVPTDVVKLTIMTPCGIKMLDTSFS